MHNLLFGASFMAYVVAALFFVHYWRQSGDRFFLKFAVAFGILGIEQIFAAFVHHNDADRAPGFLFRLVAFVIILHAILVKNIKGPLR